MNGIEYTSYFPKWKAWVTPIYIHTRHMNQESGVFELADNYLWRPWVNFAQFTLSLYSFSENSLLGHSVCDIKPMCLWFKIVDEKPQEVHVGQYQTSRLYSIAHITILGGLGYGNYQGYLIVHLVSTALFLTKWYTSRTMGRITNHSYDYPLSTHADGTTSFIKAIEEKNYDQLGRMVSGLSPNLYEILREQATGYFTKQQCEDFANSSHLNFIAVWKKIGFKMSHQQDGTDRERYTDQTKDGVVLQFYEKYRKFRDSPEEIDRLLNEMVDYSKVDPSREKLRGLEIVAESIPQLTPVLIRDYPLSQETLHGPQGLCSHWFQTLLKHEYAVPACKELIGQVFEQHSKRNKNIEFLGHDAEKGASLVEALFVTNLYLKDVLFALKEHKCRIIISTGDTDTETPPSSLHRFLARLLVVRMRSIVGGGSHKKMLKEQHRVFKDFIKLFMLIGNHQDPESISSMSLDGFGLDIQSDFSFSLFQLEDWPSVLRADLQEACDARDIEHLEALFQLYHWLYNWHCRLDGSLDCIGCGDEGFIFKTQEELYRRTGFHKAIERFFKEAESDQKSLDIYGRVAEFALVVQLGSFRHCFKGLSQEEWMKRQIIEYMFEDLQRLGGFEQGGVRHLRLIKSTILLKNIEGIEGDLAKPKYRGSHSLGYLFINFYGSDLIKNQFFRFHCEKLMQRAKYLEESILLKDIDPKSSGPAALTVLHIAIDFFPGKEQFHFLLERLADYVKVLLPSDKAKEENIKKAVAFLYKLGLDEKGSIFEYLKEYFEKQRSYYVFVLDYTIKELIWFVTKKIYPLLDPIPHNIFQIEKLRDIESDLVSEWEDAKDKYLPELKRNEMIPPQQLDDESYSDEA